MVDLPAASERFVAAAAHHGIDFAIRRFPEGTKTAADAAAAIGCAVADIVKSLVFMVDEEPVVVLIPGDRRLDTARLGALVGGSARRATLDEVKAHTGYAAGGTPPFGHASDVETLIDRSLLNQELVWAAAGTPDTVFAIPARELVEAAGGRVVDIIEMPSVSDRDDGVGLEG